MERLHLLISGRVQGVFFRAHTQEVASRLELKGWVRNTMDGSVEVLAEGDSDKLQKLLNWCKKGPSMAFVKSITESWSKATGEFADFKITY